jgi:hypothetical protein
VACTQGKDDPDFQQNSNKKEWYLIQYVAFFQSYKTIKLFFRISPKTTLRNGHKTGFAPFRIAYLVIVSVTTILKPRQGYETIYKTLTVFGFVK